MRFNLDFKSTLKSTLISKNSSCTFWGQPRFQGNLNFSPVNNNSQCLTREVWRGCEYYNLEWSSCHAIGVSGGCWLFVCRFSNIKWCCIFSQKCCGVPWFVLLLKSRLCKWEVISLISHAFQPTVNDDELSIREDEDMTFNIPWTRCFPVNSELNFFFIHQSQSTSMKILVSHTPEIDKKSESVSSVKVCCIYRAVFLTKSSEDTDALIDDCV